MLNADFQRLVKNSGPSTYFAILRDKVYTPRGHAHTLESAHPSNMVKARLMFTYPVTTTSRLATFQNAPGDALAIKWPGDAKESVFDHSREWDDELAVWRLRKADSSMRTKVYMFVIDDEAGKPAVMFACEVKRVLGAWTPEVAARVDAITAVAAIERQLAESRESRIEEAREKGQVAMNSRVLGITRTAEDLLGKRDAVRLSVSGELKWDDEKDRPVYSVTGTAMLTVGDFTRLLNIISELQTELADRA